MNDIIRERYPFEPTKKIADDLGVLESQSDLFKSVTQTKLL